MSQMLNEILRQRRKAMGWTQEQLAERVHVSRQTISNWENGRANPDYEMLKTLSEVLQTPLTELLGVSEEQPSEPPAQETQETPAVPQATGRHFRWRTGLVFTAAVVLVFVIHSFIGWWQTRPVPSPYPPEWFMEEMPVLEGQAHIVMNVLETPVKPQQYSPEYGYRWDYRVYVRENNGVGFAIDRLVEYTFWADGGHTVTETPGFHLYSSQRGNQISANAVSYFTVGDSSRVVIEGRGILMEGTDENGNQVTARCYVPYDAEVSE